MILVSISTVRWTLLHTFGMLHFNVWSIQIHLKVFLVETQHLTQQCFIQCRRPSSFATSTCCRPQVWEWQNYIKLQTSEWLPMMASGCETRKLWEQIAFNIGSLFEFIGSFWEEKCDKMNSKEGSISFLLVSIVLLGCPMGVCSFVLRVACAKRIV